MTKIAIGYYRALEKALADRMQRQEVLSQRYADAAVLGDDRENSPLDDARLAMEVNEKKIADLKHLLGNLEPVDDIAKNTVILGSVVHIELASQTRFLAVLINAQISIEAAYLPEHVRQLSVETELGKSLLDGSAAKKGILAKLRL